MSESSFFFFYLKFTGCLDSNNFSGKSFKNMFTTIDKELKKRHINH